MIRKPFVIIGLVALALATQVQAADTVKPITTFNDPTFQRWLKETQVLPAEKQVEAVVKKLAEFNPVGFSPEMFSDSRCGCSFLVEKGAVKEFKFYAAGTADISPVRAFADLKTLECFGDGDGAVGQGGKLTDLSPLRGMALQRLNCSNTGVADLSPLKGLPLTSLECAGTAVADLTPLTGMKLTRLDCNFSLVSDLSPLRGMPLLELDCAGTEVADLSPLLRMPLTDLWCDYTQVSDLTPLTECKQLKNVYLHHTKVIASDVAKLQKSRPNCSVRWDDWAMPQRK